MDPQGWQGLPLALLACYGWIPFALVGGLLGVIAWFRAQTQNNPPRQRTSALIAVILSALSPVVGIGAVWLLPMVKHWIWS